jgi:proteasome assembly chaperone (PAC2) family protein
MENPMAALAILKTFMRLLDIEIETKELAENAREMTEQIKQAMTIAMGEYIEHFTQPIWEQGEGEGEEDEGDDEGNIGDQN